MARLIKPPAQQPPEIPPVPLTILLTIALVAIYTVLHAAVLLQFNRSLRVWGGENSDIGTLVWQSAKVTPAIAFMVYLTAPRVSQKWMQIVLALVSGVSGWYSMQIMTNHTASYGDLSKAPGLGVVWAYCLMQLDLKAASFSLLIVLGINYVTQWWTSSTLPGKQ